MHNLVLGEQYKWMGFYTVFMDYTIRYIFFSLNECVS